MSRDLILAFLICMPAFLLATTGSTSSSDLLEKGAQRLEDKQWNEALQIYTEALKIQVDSALAYCGRAQALIGKKQYDDAFEDLAESLRLNPELAETWRVRSRLNRIVGNLEQALSDGTKAVTLAPQYAKAYRTRAHAYLRKNRAHEAFADFGEAIVHDPHSPYGYVGRAAAARRLGRYQHALGDCATAITLDPDIPNAYQTRAAVHMSMEAFDLAIKDYDTLIVLKPKVAASYRWRGEAHLLRNDVQQAMRDFSTTIELDPSWATPYVRRGHAYLSQQKSAHAIADFKQAIARDVSLDLRELITALVVRESLLEEATADPARQEGLDLQEDYLKILSNNAVSDIPVEIWIGLGHHYGILELEQESLEAFDRALKVDPSSADAHYGRGIALHRLGHFEDSAAEYEFVVRAQPERAKGWLHLGIARGELGQYDEEIMCYERSARLDPEDALISFNLGMALREQGDLPKARQSFEAYVDKHPDDPDGLANLAGALADSGEPELAIEYARRATDINPQHVVALYNSGIAHLLLRNRRACDLLLTRLAALDRESAAKLEAIRTTLVPSSATSAEEELVFLLDQLESLQVAEDYDNAILVAHKAYLVAREVHGRDTPISIQALHSLARVQLQLGRFQDSQRNLVEAMSLCDKRSFGDPLRCSRIMEDIARVNMLLGRPAECEAQCVVLLSMYEDHEALPENTAGAHALLVDSLLTQRDSDDPEVERALNQWATISHRFGRKRSINSARNHHLLGSAYLRLGRNTEAKRHLTQAMIWRQELGRATEAARSELLLGSLALSEDRITEAIDFLRNAHSQLTHALGTNHPDVAIAHAQLGGALRAAGQYSDAEEELRQALKSFESHRSQPRGELGRAFFGERLGIPFATHELVATLIQQGRNVEAMEVVERLRASALRQRMAASGTYVSPTNWRQVRSSLGDKDVLLSIQWSSDVISALLISGSESEVYGYILVDGGESVLRLQRLANDVRIGLRTWDKGVIDNSMELGQALFPSSQNGQPHRLRHQLEAASRIIVVVDTPLAQVPFDLLLRSPHARAPSAQVAPATALDVTYTPSANIFVHLSEIKQKLSADDDGTTTIMLVGPPDYTQWQQHIIREGITNKAIARLAQNKGHSLIALESSRATRQHIDTRAHEAHIIHFLAEGIPGTKANPYRANLVLTPRHVPPDPKRDSLTLEHILSEWDHRLPSCRLITLAACETQLGVPIGTNAITLPWGFFYAGCPTVVATLWPVYDDAAHQIMNRFYENTFGAYFEERIAGTRKYSAGTSMPASHALTEARQWLRAQKPSKGKELEGHDYSHPYFWAGFVVIGDPG